MADCPNYIKVMSDLKKLSKENNAKKLLNLATHTFGEIIKCIDSIVKSSPGDGFTKDFGILLSATHKAVYNKLSTSNITDTQIKDYIDNVYIKLNVVIANFMANFMIKISIKKDDIDEIKSVLKTKNLIVSDENKALAIAYGNMEIIKLITTQSGDPELLQNIVIDNPVPMLIEALKDNNQNMVDYILKNTNIDPKVLDEIYQDIWIRRYVKGNYTSKDKILHNIPLDIETNKHCKKIDGSLLVYRGISKLYLKEWYNTEIMNMSKDTITINPKTVTSWTTNLGTAEQFAEDGIIIKTVITQPQVLCDLREYNKDEMELILKPGVIKTKILQTVEYNEDETDTIECDEIPKQMNIFRHVMEDDLDDWVTHNTPELQDKVIILHPKENTIWTKTDNYNSVIGEDTEVAMTLKATVKADQIECVDKNSGNITVKPGTIKATTTRQNVNIKKVINEFNKSSGEFLSKLKEHFSFVKKLGGSNQGGLFKEPTTDKLYYIKLYTDPNQAYIEHLANDFYSKMGAKVPKTRIVVINGNTVYISSYITNQQKFNLMNLRPGIARRICDDLVYDQFLANWDVVGQYYSNIILTTSNEIYRIDNGGSLMYRAQGDLKSQDDYSKIIIANYYKKILAMTNYTTFCDIPGYRSKLNKIVSLRDTFGGFENYIKQVVPELSAELLKQTTDIFEQRLSVIQQSITDCAKLI
jgi:hypothetical protein